MHACKVAPPVSPSLFLELKQTRCHFPEAFFPFLLGLPLLQPISYRLRGGIWNELPQHPREGGREGGVVVALRVRKGKRQSILDRTAAAVSQLSKGRSQGGRKGESPATGRYKRSGAAARASHLPLPPVCG